jgi:ElaB/YqjD/DUF883 family membrane-anchored ribosome-binding protein
MTPVGLSTGRQAQGAQVNMLTFCGFIQFFERFIMSTVSESLVNTQEKLVSAIRSEISDAEEMLSATADQAGEKITKLRSRIENRLREAKYRLVDAEAALVAKTKAAAHATDDYVHESPWTSIGIAAGLGLIVGVLLGRR